MADCCGRPCSGSTNPDWCPSAPATQNVLGVPPPRRNACPGRIPNFSRGLLLGGNAWGGGERVRLVESLCGGAQPSSATIIPRDPNFARGPPLGVVAFGERFLFFDPL